MTAAATTGDEHGLSIPVLMKEESVIEGEEAVEIENRERTLKNIDEVRTGLTGVSTE